MKLFLVPSFSTQQKGPKVRNGLKLKEQIQSARAVKLGLKVLMKARARVQDPALRLQKALRQCLLDLPC